MTNEPEKKPEGFDDTATLERMARLKPLVKDIQELIATSDLPVGNNTQEDDDKYFPIAEEILKMMVDADIKFIEKEVLFQLLFQSVDKLKSIVLGSLNKSFNKAMDIKFGMPFEELGMKVLDETIKLSAVPVASEENKDIPVA